MLTLNNISKRVGNEEHIRDVSITLTRGSVNVLLGPTLAGKTTLMRLMAGLDKPTSGDITFNNQSVLGKSVRKRNVAMVYQQFINYPGLTVYENIASPMRLARVDSKTLDSKVRSTARLLKLDPFLDRKPLELSGGQQQRTAIARALVKEADLVLLDEPLANLDYKLREELRIELPRVFQKTGAIFVYATTEPQEALLLGGNTATLSEGMITQFGRTLDVYNQPADLPTAQTFSDPPFNIADVIIRNGEIILNNTSLGFLHDHAPALPDGSYTAGIRPYHLSLQPTDTHSIALQCTVGTSEITGSETFVHVDVAGQKWVALVHGVHKFSPQEQIYLYVNPALVYLFDPDGALIHTPPMFRHTEKELMING